jgi:pyruvate,water dikinase
MFHLRGFYEFIADKGKLTLEQACNLTTEETSKFLKEGKLPATSDLEMRASNKALFFYVDGKIEVLYDPEKIKQIGMKLENVGEKNEVIGMTANKGKAAGPAKIILHTMDLKKVNEGDIFIAKFTYPDYTPHMAKCAAIVADDGGITSHAAIISREYDIPCIVGTKHATKVFRDGEMVEVDATLGIIRRMALK